MGNCFLLWEGVVVLKEMILTVSTLGGFGGLERTDFNNFYFGKVWWSWKELIFTSFYFERAWWS